MKSHVVPKDWAGESVAIVASGPSVRAFDFTRIEGLRTIAVKDGFLLCPRAEVLMIGDHRYARRTPDLSGYLGPLILYTDPEPLPETLLDPRIEFIPKVAGGGLSEDPTCLRGTFTTTALAINYACLRGAKRIYLVGVDGQAGPSGERHFVEGSKQETWPKRYERQAWGLDRIPRDLHKFGAKVFNLNPNSRIRAFPRGKLGGL